MAGFSLEATGAYFYLGGSFYKNVLSWLSQLCCQQRFFEQNDWNML